MLGGNCTEALSIQANVTISGSSAKLIKKGIAPLPFPPRAATAILVHKARGEGQGEGTCSILCNVRVHAEPARHKGSRFQPSHRVKVFVCMITSTHWMSSSSGTRNPQNIRRLPLRNTQFTDVGLEVSNQSEDERRNDYGTHDGATGVTRL